MLGGKGFRKGTDLLANLVDPSRLPDDAELWVVGPEESSDMELVRASRAALSQIWGNQLRWVAPVDDIEDVFAAASVLLLPSRAEARPRVVEEALIRGVPVVANPLPGILDIEDALIEPGALVTRTLDEDWTSSIAALLTARLPRRRFVESVTAEKFLADWLAVIDQVADFH